MSLANEITYNGKLECVSEEIAEKKIIMNEDFMKKVFLVKRIIIYHFIPLYYSFKDDIRKT
jgi:hypothetical protein